MRRPLLTVCLCLIAVLALREAIGLARGTPFGEGRGSIAELDLPKRGEVTVTGRVYQKDTDYFYLNSIVICLAEDPRQSLQVTDNCIVEQQEWERGQEPLLGSVVTVEGVYRPFSEAGNPGEFDQKRYYHSLGIGCRLTDARIQSRTLEYSGLRETLYRLRKHWERRLYAIFPQKEASVMATILLGERAGLDREIRELYQRNGIVGTAHHGHRSRHPQAAAQAGSPRLAGGGLRRGNADPVWTDDRNECFRVSGRGDVSASDAGGADGEDLRSVDGSWGSGSRYASGKCGLPLPQRLLVILRVGPGCGRGLPRRLGAVGEGADPFRAKV